MIPGLCGSLLSHDALDAAPDVIDRTAAHRRLAAWHEQVRIEGGPAWPARVVFDRVAVPFCRLLGFEVIPAGGEARWCRALLHREGNVAATMSAFAWGQDPGTTWRESVRGGIAAGSRWCYCFAGPTLRVFDAHADALPALRRVRSRHPQQPSGRLRLGLEPARRIRLLWTKPCAAPNGTGRRCGIPCSWACRMPSAISRGRSRLRIAVAPRARRSRAVDLLDESLVVVYRVLFLLFAEARGLVPAWHPVYRDSYTIESLRRLGRNAAAPARRVGGAAGDRAPRAPRLPRGHVCACRLSTDACSRRSTRRSRSRSRSTTARSGMRCWR